LRELGGALLVQLERDRCVPLRLVGRGDDLVHVRLGHGCFFLCADLAAAAVLCALGALGLSRGAL
jgi:hypothetical protein